MDRWTDNCILRALVRKRKYQINHIHISLQGGVDGRGVNELEPNRQPPRVNYFSNIHYIYTLISSQIYYVFLVIAEALL